VALSECRCGEPLYEHQPVCPQCGARNASYVQFGWGRRIAIIFAGLLAYQATSIIWEVVSGRTSFMQLNLLGGALGAGVAYLAFRLYDAARLGAARK